MYLKKFKLIPEKRNNKFFFNSFHPFSAFKTSKIKNDFLKQIIKYKEQENICVSSFGIDPLNTNNNKIEKRNNKSANKLVKSLSGSFTFKNLKKMLSLKNIIKKNSLPIISPLNINYDSFPDIKRSLKKFKTNNLSINTNNINNVQLKNTLLKNIFSQNTFSSNNEFNQIGSSPFITDIKEKKQINSSSNFEKNIDNSNELLTSNKRKNNLGLYKSTNFNHHFSDNILTPNNNNSQKALIFEKPFLPRNKLGQKFYSNKIIMNIKSLSTIKSPLSNRIKTNNFHSFSDKKVFSYKNIFNKNNKNNKNKSNDLAPQRNLSSSEELKLSLDNKLANNTKIINKKYIKKFNLMIKDKLFDLEKGIDKDSKEQEKTEDEYNLYIKYMIKKCKFIYNVLDKNLSIKIPDSDYNIKKQKISKFNFSKMNNKNSKRRELTKVKAKLKENEFKILQLINKYNYLCSKANHKIDKLNEVSKFSDKKNNKK